MKSQEVRGKTMQSADLGLFHLLKRHPSTFAYFFRREVIPSTKESDQIISLLGHAKELCAKPQLHLSGGFVGEGEGYDLGDGQRVGLSHEKIQYAVDQDCGLAGSGSGDHDDIAVPCGLRQEPILRVRKYQHVTHRVFSAFLTVVTLEPWETGRSATKPWHRGVCRHRKTRSSRNSHREEYKIPCA